MTLDRYFRLTWYDRWAMHEELTERIEAANAAAEEENGSVALRPKDLRR